MAAAGWMEYKWVYEKKHESQAYRDKEIEVKKKGEVTAEEAADIQGMMDREEGAALIPSSNKARASGEAPMLMDLDDDDPVDSKERIFA